MAQNLFDLTQKFTKYVKFLSNHFDIQVEFDTPNCKREENTIYLPSLTSMSAQEINVLWGVLLQEAGFIKYGEMKQEENLVKFKTHNHAKLIKLLEAARVEHKLLAQFDGAQDMIEPLYTNCVQDAGLRAKFFPQSAYSDVWAGVCYYAHQKSMGVAPPDIDENLLALLGKKSLVKKTKDFITSSQLDKVLSAPNYEITKNSTGEDVIKLANKIHTMYFAGLDKSERIDYAKKIAEKKKIEKAAQEAQAKFEAFKEELAKQEELLEKIKSQLREEKKKIEPVFRPLQQQKNTLTHQQSKLNKLSNAQEKIAGLERNQKYNEDLISRNNEKINQLKESIDNIEARLQNQHNPQLELDGVKEKNKEILEQLGFKDNFDMAALENNLEDKQKSLEETTEQKNNIENYLDSKSSLDSIEQKEQKQAAQAKSLEEKISEHTKKTQALKDKLQELEQSGATDEKTLESKNKLEEKLLDAQRKSDEQQEQKATVQNKQELTAQQKAAAQQQLADNDFKNEEGQSAEDLEKQNQAQEQSLKDIKEQIKALNQELSKHTLDDEKKEKLENKKTKQEEKVDSLTEKNTARQEKADSFEAQAQRLSQEVVDLNQEFNSPSEEKLSELSKQNNEELAQTQQALDKLTTEVKKAENELKNERTKNDRAQERIQQEVMAQAFDIQEACEKMGIDAGILPEFVEMEGWDEANDIQREFDKQQSIDTNQIVTNGAGFQFKGYDTITELMNKINDVAEINVQDLFKDVVSNNPLDSFAQETKEKTQDTGEYKFGRSVRPHIPASREFDKIETKNRLTNPDKIKDFTQMRMQLTGPARDIKNIVKTKFKFTKKPFYRGGKEDGELDSRSLYKLATGLDDNFYEKNNPKFINKIAAKILLDFSGSNLKEYTEQGAKMKKMAYLLSEGLKEAHIPHEISAFGAEFSEAMSERQYSDFYNRRQHALKTVVLKKFEDKSNEGLGNFEVQPIDNCDGESLEAAYNSLKKRSEKQKMIFVISDGKPFLNDANVEILDEDLRRVVRRITEEKSHIFALGFNDGPEQLYGNRYQKVQDWRELGNFIKSIDLTGAGIAVSQATNSSHLKNKK